MGDSILRPHGENTMADKRINISRQEKELGVIIDSKLSPECHIKEKVGEVYDLLSNTQVAFTHMDEDMMVKLLATFI